MIKYILCFILSLTLVSCGGQTDKKPKQTKKKVEKTETKKTSDRQAPETNNDSTLTTEDFTESYEATFMKTLLVLVSLIILIGLVIWMFKRLSQTRINQMNYLKSIKIIEKRPISPKSILYLIEVAGRQILISESQLEVRQLTTLDYPKEKDL